MSITIDKQYKLFKERLSNDISTKQQQLNDCLDNINYNIKMIKSINTKFNYPITDYHLNIYYTTNDQSIIDLRAASRVESKLPNKLLNTETRILWDNVNQFIKNKRLIHNIQEAINKGEAFKNKLTSTKYIAIIRALNVEISNHVIRGGLYSFSKELSHIYIKEKIRDTHVNGINWGESNKFKAQLIAEGKTPYDKKLNPDGEKWFVYHTNTYNYWWKWNSNFCNFPNIQYYIFDPTCYVNTPTRKKQDFLDTCKSNDDIINSNLLGNVEKVNYLIEFDPLYHLTYRRYAHYKLKRDSR